MIHCARSASDMQCSALVPSGCAIDDIKQQNRQQQKKLEGENRVGDDRIATPCTSHLSDPRWQCVYPPSEDTFALLDALELELPLLRRLQPTLALEIGCGSGVVATAMATTLSTTGWWATDISMAACQAAILTASSGVASGRVWPVRSDLAGGLRCRFDLIVFNPPYVPTTSAELHTAQSTVRSSGLLSSDEKEDEGGDVDTRLSASWAGGPRGRCVIDRFLHRFPELLSNGGVLYMVVIEENGVDQLAEIAAADGFVMHVVLRRRAGCEALCVLRFRRENNSKCLDSSNA